MFTDVRSTSTDLLMCGKDAAALIRRAFGAETTDGMAVLPGVMSRKKQLVPSLIAAMKPEE